MRIQVYSILAATLCVSQVAGFAGLTETISPFLENANAIASSVPVATDLLNSYKHALEVHPLETKMLTGGMLATMGDAIAQSREPEVYDKKRGASFASFDMCYRALQHNVFPLIVATCKGQFFLGAIATIPAVAKFVSQNVDPTYFGAMEQTLASQLIVVPFIYYPVFFALSGAIQGLTVEGAIERAKEKFIPLMERNLLFWIPVQFVQFAFIQEDLQIPFLCACGLAWTFILSIMAGSTKEYSYCVTGMEGECILPDELFPIEEMAHELEEMEHQLEEGVGEFVHELEEMEHQLEENVSEFVHDVEENLEVVVHDISVALHLETEDVEPTNGTADEVAKEKVKEEEEALMK